MTPAARLRAFQLLKESPKRQTRLPFESKISKSCQGKRVSHLAAASAKPYYCSMGAPRLQFGLRTLFVVLTGSAVLVWWPKYGRPLYDDWQAPRRLRAALRSGDPESFVTTLQCFESVLRKQPGNQQLWDSYGNVPPRPLPIDDGLADECCALLASPSAEVRVLAALTVSLTRRQPCSEVRLLASILEDPCTEVRAMAAYGLKCYGNEAMPAVRALARIIKASGNKYTIDERAAWDVLVDLDRSAAMQAAGVSRIRRWRGVWGEKPSDVADQFLGKIYPTHQQDSDERYLQDYLERQLRSWRERLAAAESDAERDECQSQVHDMAVYIRTVKDSYAARRAQRQNKK